MYTAARRTAAAVLAGLISLASLAPASASTLTWTITPNPTINGNAQLNSVSCPSASFCVAVGMAHNGRKGPAHPLIESWNGKTWSLMRTPSEPKGKLWGVSCPSDRYCVAVGFFGKFAASLIERWNGRSWALAQPSMPGDTLGGVSCASASACAAVGTNGKHNLAEMWNGSAWSVIPTPNQGGSTGDAFDGVSCPSATRCTAVGDVYHLHPASQLYPEIESWNGTKWSFVPSPKGSNELNGVSCASASSCSAVGSSDVRFTLYAETWNGARWSRAALSGQLPIGSAFNDVACVSAVHCTAAGSGFTRSLIWSWNGKTWSRVPTPNPSKHQENQLMGVACSSARACAAVGYITPLRTRMTPVTEIGR